MKAVIQRVKKAKVTSNEKTLGSIGKKKGGKPPTHPKGMVILLGVGKNDNEKTVEEMADKILKLRIFPSLPAGKVSSDKNIDRSVQDIQGEILVVPQFTLYADTSKGNRPGFLEAADPDKAKELYLSFINCLEERGLKIASGEFGAMMNVSLVNDGPVTIILEE